MASFQVEIDGLSPLLMHYDNIEYQDAYQAAGQKGGKAGDDRHPVDRWKSYLYTDAARERVVVPAENLMAALGKVGGSIAIGGKKTLKTASQGVVFDDLDLPLLSGPKLKPVDFSAVADIDGTFAEQAQAANKLGFSLFVKRCTVGTSRHIRVRPRFEKWSLRGTFQVWDDVLTLERLRMLFEVAGKAAGLCDWRPGSPRKPGSFGRFEAKVSKA